MFLSREPADTHVDDDLFQFRHLHDILIPKIFIISQNPFFVILPMESGIREKVPVVSLLSLPFSAMILFN